MRGFTYSSVKKKARHPHIESLFDMLDVDILEGYCTTNLEVSNHSKVRTEGFDRLKPGKSYYGTQNNKRLDLRKVGPTITSHRTQYVHPTLPRVLTVRESAAIMGFPNNFTFYGPRTKQFDQVGCAIVPQITNELCIQIKEHYELNF